MATLTLLIVAGGGGGASQNGGAGGAGGGGAGGLLEGDLVRAPGSYTVTVGAGGAGGADADGTDGGNSVFDTATALGGGGGKKLGNGRNGGSGGGAGTDAAPTTGGAATQGNSAGLTGYGNAGGGAIGDGNGGGGGGAGGAGSGVTAGAGRANSITGASVTYAAGGPGAGASADGTDADANTGNGGEARFNSATRGGNGGSGVVIVRYPTGSIAATGGTITTSGGDTIHTFTSSGTFVFTFAQAVAGTVASAGAITERSIARALTGVVAPAGALSRAIARALASAVTSIVGNTAKQTQRLLTASVGSAGTLDGLKLRLVDLAGSVASAGTLTRQTARTLAGSVSSAGSLTKQLARLLVGVVSAAATLVGRRIQASTIQVYASSTERTSYVRLGSLEIEDVLNDAPNRCTFTAVGWTPAEGEVVRVTRGVAAHLEFAGHIISVEQFYESILANVAYHVTCIDYTWKLNRRLVTKRWTNVSATTIAQEIISGFTTGFTSTAVAGSLATIPEFRCDEEKPSEALSRLCAEIGGNWYVDYLLDLHLFLTEVTDTPDDISDATLATTTARGLAHIGDLSQVRTRIRGVGIGSPARENIPAALTSIPLESTDMFDPAGGSLKNTENIATYTGRHLGGVSATVAGTVSGPSAPSGSPSPAVTSGQVGVLAGIYKYLVAFGNTIGETTPGPESAPVTCTAFAPPIAASVAASGVIGPLVGVYLYVLTYVTALGETSAGTSFGRTATAVAAPGAASIAAGSTIGKLIGAYNYRITVVTPFGETEGGTVFSRTAAATATPGSPSVAVVSSTIGKLIGAYGYKITTVDAYGESAASSAGTRTASAQSAPSAPTVSTSAASCDDGPLRPGFDYRWKVAFVAADGTQTLGSASSINTPSATVASAPAISGDGTGNSIRCRVAWQSKWGESEWSNFTTDTNHGATVTVTPTDMPSTCETWVDFNTGSYVGAAPSDYYRHPKVHIGTGASTLDTLTGTLATAAAGTMGKKANLTSIPTGPTGTVSRRIYRTKGDGSSYFLVGEIGDNSTTTFTDETHDDALTVLAPLSNLNGEQHTVSSISTGATGTTKRRIYRTKAGGSTYYLLDELLDNSTTTYTDNKPDTELNLAITAPSSATSGDQHALTSIPTGPSGTIARRIYRTQAGGSIYYLLHTLPDNVTTSYTDNKSDAELGAEAVPTTTTAGGQVHSLTSIPTGPTGTLARRIYRTIAGGTSYQFVGELTDNTATAFTDNLADADLAHYVPLVNTAGANKVTLSSIPTGGAGVTKRVLYRTEAGGSTFRYLGTIEDNVTTTFVDNRADTELGREPLAASTSNTTIGAEPGDTTIPLDSVAGWPTAGWLDAAGAMIRYTGISGNSLTGIPVARSTTITRSGTTATATTSGSHGFATNDVVTIQGAAQPEYNGAHTITVTGLTTFTFTVAGAPATPATGTITVLAVGAILSSIPSGLGVVTAPFLSGVSGLTYTVEKGGQVRIYVVRNDSAAQTALAALEGGDGIHEAPLDDASIETLTQLTAACDAELDAYSGKLRTVMFRSRDPLLRSGKTITLNLGAPTNQSGDFLIQRVISTEFDTAPDLNPMRDVIAAPVRLSFQDVMKRARNGT